MNNTLTIPEVAKILLCDDETAAERVNKGDLPGVKFGRSWVIPAAAFFQRLNELALEEAERRRKEREGERDTAVAKGTRAAANTSQARAVLSVAVQAPSQRGRARRVPPPLPNFPTETVS